MDESGDGKIHEKIAMQTQPRVEIMICTAKYRKSRLRHV